MEKDPQEIPRSPLTGTTNLKLEEELSVGKILESYQKQNIDVRRFFQGLDLVKVYKCLDSQYRFYYPLNIAGDETFYDDLQEEKGYYRIRPEHRIARRFIAPNSKVLEIGCGFGLFLDELKSDGILCAGLEFSNAAVTTGQARGLDILKKDIFDYSSQHAEEYDVVCSFQVLEHIVETRRFIEASIKVLKPGGRLIIGVPNNNPYLYRYDKYHSLNLPPHHMGLWDRYSLANLELYFPLKLEKIIVEPLHRYEYDHYFKVVCYSKREKNIIRSFWNKIVQFFLVDLKPSKLRRVFQTLVSLFVEGRNILVVYQKEG